MRFIQRDENGNVIAHFANEQSYARELVEDDHPDILIFKATIEANRGPTLQEQLADVYARLSELERKTALLP